MRKAMGIRPHWASKSKSLRIPHYVSKSMPVPEVATRKNNSSHEFSNQSSVKFVAVVQMFLAALVMGLIVKDIFFHDRREDNPVKIFVQREGSSESYLNENMAFYVFVFALMYFSLYATLYNGANANDLTTVTNCGGIIAFILVMDFILTSIASYNSGQCLFLDWMHALFIILKMWSVGAVATFEEELKKDAEVAKHANVSKFGV